VATTTSYYIIAADGTRQLVNDTVPDSVVNQQALAGKAQAALTTNATFLGLASPSTAQNTAQVQALTRQVNALVRLVLDQFDTTAGT
jgi:SRSO17 transposase